ncbi:MAG: hypothetical protein EZS28_018331 [Streblomastix strix]|uniref:Uncharacterized protein n=1 Tax=Streblomastix strix TaxID=222440 RepID=A0A5J4VUU5_9EUKA|nr:MAG: hypothetical protein EZS28_018331 [Streblomastix strix]
MSNYGNPVYKGTILKPEHYIKAMQIIHDKKQGQTVKAPMAKHTRSRIKKMIQQADSDINSQEASVEDPYTGHYKPHYNPNAVAAEISQDIGSKKLPAYPMLLRNDDILDLIEQNKEKEPRQKFKEGDDIQDPFQLPLEFFTDDQEHPDIASSTTQYEKEKEIEGKIIKADNKNTDFLLYQKGALDWGQDAINSIYSKQPFAEMKYTYQTAPNGPTSIRQQKQVLTKESKINTPKQRKNYINPSQLKKSVAAQETLKKYGKNKKKK